MNLLVLVVVANLVVLQFAQEADAVCCRWNPDAFVVCHNKPSQFHCCGIGRCNIFCCDCEGGCLIPKRRRFAGDHPIEFILRERRNGTHVVALGDRDGDGKMSLEEGLAHLEHPEDKEVVKRSLREMDLDGDGFLSPIEIDPSL